MWERSCIYTEVVYRPAFLSVLPALTCTLPRVGWELKKRQFGHADGAFAKQIGSRAGRGAEHLKYGLWLAGQQLSGGQKASKAIHIYSNNLDPSAGGKPKDR